MSEALISQLNEMTLREREYSEEEEEDDEEGKKEEETADSWLRRHLLSLLSCEESAVDALLVDVSPIISLITCEEKGRTVFITIQKSKYAPREMPISDVPTVHFDLEKLEKRIEKRDRTRNKTQKMKKRGGSKSRSKSSSRSPAKKSKERRKKGTEVTKKKKRKKPDSSVLEQEKKIAEQVAKAQLEREIQLVLPQPPEIILNWHLDRSIPTGDQFIFIAIRSEKKEFESTLDNLFHVGYVNKNRFLKAALSTAAKLFEKRLIYEMNLDILLAFYGIEERKMAKECLMENFIIDCIIRHFCVESRVRLDNIESRSVQALLQPIIQKFCTNSDQYNRNCLLLQLSFFDIDLLDERTEIFSCANRLERAVKTLRALSFLFTDSVLDWCRRMFLLIIDVFSTILARHVTRKCDLLINFDQSKIQAICSTFSNTVSSIRELSQMLYDSVEDRAPVEKMVFSFNVVMVLEEEVDEILQKVADLHCEKRDTAFDRTGIREAQGILRQLNDFLEENCMESAVESSNLDSLRMLARNLSSFHKRLDGIMAMLPD